MLAGAGILLCLVALIAVAVPGVFYARALDEDGVDLTGGRRHVVLPPHETWGIYVDDADNSGYSERCSAHDADGRTVRMQDPPWSFSTSDTENLDLVFDTGSGRQTIDCAVSGEEVTARRLPNNDALLIGFVLAAILGACGGCMLIALAAGWSRQATTTALTPVKQRDLLPAIVATAVGLPLLGLTAWGWLGRLVAARSLGDDPELWNEDPPGHGPPRGRRLSPRGPNSCQLRLGSPWSSPRGAWPGTTAPTRRGRQQPFPWPSL